MNKAQHIALSVALFFNFSLSALARDSTVDSGAQWYQVDLVVFRYLNNDSGEGWPAVRNHTTPMNSIRLQTLSEDTGDTTPESTISESGNQPSNQLDIMRDAYVALPTKEMMLNRQVETLDENRNYQLITQMAWRMPVNSNSAEHPVEIKALIGGQNSLLLDGTVNVSEDRFLHVDVDLWLNMLSPESLHSNIGLNSFDTLTSDKDNDNLVMLHDGSAPLRITDNFQLKQKRRVRNTNEIQYIDSPEIGVLFKLTPYKPPDKQIETDI